MNESEMIERVAEAINDKIRDFYIAEWATGFGYECAKAAIEAMREPTDAMAEFAEDNFDRNGDNIKVCWRAMIDAALSPSAEKG